MTRWMTRFAILGIAILVISPHVRAADDREDVKEMKKALAAAKVTLEEAVRIAEREVPGARAIEVELEWKNGRPRIEVELVSGDVWKDVYIDAVSGRVIRTSEDRPEDAEEREELRRDKEAIEAAKLSFAQAIEEDAKREAGGQVVEIDLEMKGNRPEYKVKLLAGERFKTIRIDAKP